VNIITCPSCQTRLRLPEQAGATGYTCPRCLAEVKPGGQSNIATEPSPARTQTERASPEARCRYCDAPLTSPDWRYCPRCAAVLDASAAARTQPALDEDFHRDRKRTGVFTVIQLVVGSIALVVTALGAFGTGQPGVMGAVLLVLAVLTAIVWGVIYLRTRGHREDMTAGRVVQGVVETVGALVIGYLVIAAVVAVFLLAVCLGSGIR
jgi:hypothetical protein